MSFAQIIKSFAPGYFTSGRWGTALLESVGGMLDDQAERLFLGRCAALPYAGHPTAKRASDGHLLQCEPDVFPYHARDRGITLYASEPEYSKRFRLSRWRQLRARKGTHRGEMEHLQPYFLGADGLGVLPRIRIVHQDGDGDGAMWHTLSGTADTGGAGVYSIYRKTPTNWNFDYFLESWSRWWAIIYTTGTILEDGITHWDDGAFWDGGQVWDGVPVLVLADLIAMLIEWGAAHSQCAGIILANDDASFSPLAAPSAVGDGRTTLPEGNWGRLVDPSTGLPTRLQSASFILDRYYQ